MVPARQRPPEAAAPGFAPLPAATAGGAAAWCGPAAAGGWWRGAAPYTAAAAAAGGGARRPGLPRRRPSPKQAALARFGAAPGAAATGGTADGQAAAGSPKSEQWVANYQHLCSILQLSQEQRRRRHAQLVMRSHLPPAMQDERLAALAEMLQCSQQEAGRRLQIASILGFTPQKLRTNAAALGVLLHVEGEQLAALLRRGTALLARAPESLAVRMQRLTALLARYGFDADFVRRMCLAKPRCLEHTRITLNPKVIAGRL